MAASRKSGGGNVALALANVKRRSGGGWVTATIAKRRSGGAWVDIFVTALVDIVNQTASALTASPGTAGVEFRMDNAGVQSTYEKGVLAQTNNWLLSGAASAYDVKVDVVGDPVGGDATGSWLNLGTTRSWTMAQVGVGLKEATLTVSVRNASTLAVLDTATVNLSAEVF